MNDAQPTVISARSHLRMRGWAFALAAVALILWALGGTRADAASGPAVVRADGDCLNMRQTPSLSGTLITCLPEGTQVFLLGTSTTGDGIVWQQISAVGQNGWAASVYLVPGTAPSTPAATSVATPVVTAAPTGFAGSLATGGGYALVLWRGGTVEAMSSSAGGLGCAMRSVWVTRSGRLVSYIIGAPSFVNAEWVAQLGTGPLPETPVIVVCASGGGVVQPTPTATGTAPVPTAPPSTPVATVTATPVSGPGSTFPRNVPPGPAGNE